MAEYEFQTQPENEPNAFVRPVDIPVQLGRENVSELVRNAMQLAETAIKGGIGPEPKSLVAQPAEVHGPEGEVLSLADFVELTEKVLAQRAQAVEVSRMRAESNE